MPLNDNYALKHCPYCGNIQFLTVHVGDTDRAIYVACNDMQGGGCGAMAPLATWGLRREPDNKALLNTSPRVLVISQ